MKAARSILTALRRETVDATLVESIKLQVYQACLLSDAFQKAVDLYPTLKSLVGERLKGINSFVEIGKTGAPQRQFLLHYFSVTPNAQEGLMKIFTDPSMITDRPAQQPETIYHFGSALPIFYILANCSDFQKGLCGNCSGESETRLRRILGENFKIVQPGFITRACEFASKFA